MAVETTIGGEGTLFIGEDKTLRFEVIDKSNLPVDLSGFTLVFDVRKKDNSPSPAILSKTPTITGVFSPSRSTNTQRVEIALSDDDMNLFKPQGYRHSLKRMDAGNETVLAWGDFVPQKATAP